MVELRDGRLLMIIRSQLGRLQRSLSRDQGVTWSPTEPMEITTPEAPSSIARLPSDELLLVWNNSVPREPDWLYPRNPLTCAISRDEGETWENVKDLENRPGCSFCYISIAFVGPASGPGVPRPDRVIFTYYSTHRSSGMDLKLKSLPLSWLRE